MPYSDPNFPVVNPHPSVDDCIGSFRVRDYAVTGGVTSACWGYGYIFGKPARMPTASTAAALGFTFAGFMILQDARDRLMGYKENAKEVKLYGLHAAQPNILPQTDARFPTATGLMSHTVKPDPVYKNYD
jgi:hypothetical protein